MHKQHPQTAYRKYAVSIGTIFENCDKRYFSIFLHKQRACLSILRMGGFFFCVPLLTAVRQSDMILVSKKHFRPHKEGTSWKKKLSPPKKAASRCCCSASSFLRRAQRSSCTPSVIWNAGKTPSAASCSSSPSSATLRALSLSRASRCSSRRKRWCSPSSATMQAPCGSRASTGSAPSALPSTRRQAPN